MNLVNPGCFAQALIDTAPARRLPYTLDGTLLGTFLWFNLFDVGADTRTARDWRLKVLY